MHTTTENEWFDVVTRLSVLNDSRFGISFVLQLVSAGVLAMFIGGAASLPFALFAGMSVGLFWVAPALGVVYLFEQRRVTGQ